MVAPGGIAAVAPLRVLHVEDSEDDSLLVMRELRRGGFAPRCERVDTQRAFKEALQREDWDVIISDYSLPYYNGLTALADAREAGKDIPFILVSGTIGEDGAVNAMKAGAQDYVLKDSLGRLPLAVEREVREAAIRARQRTMAEQLAISERMASAGMLAAGVAHEINNPLAVVMANLDFVTSLLGRLAPDARLEEIDGPLEDARDAVARIGAIVRDVKLFSRPQDEERSAVDVRPVIESSIRMAWNEIRHRAELIKELGDVPLVDSNEARLGQILLNLLVNAAQSMPEGRASRNEIRVATRTAENGRVVIEVRDTGTGIPREVLARIFDPFFTTKPVGVGTGLGLSLCHRMVTDLGGDIAVESEVGKGTVFRVTLPVATSEPPAKPQRTTAAAPPRRARVMVVDDEVALGRALGRGLGRLHDVVVLASGKEALARIASGERFDAILSDLMMPEVTGMEIYAELLRIAPDQAERVIFLTGGAFTERAREFLDCVPNTCVEKPFEVSNILAIIAAARRLKGDGHEG
ncbi:MAG TPA: response regulator [Labilithrix sp.]|nr:response regulator [Labilithrix sp.]